MRLADPGLFVRTRLSFPGGAEGGPPDGPGAGWSPPGARGTAEEAPAETEESTEAQTEAPSPYDTIAITRVNNYVNIRDAATTEGNVVGKIYNNAAATILETVDGEDGQWYYIKSGSVKGYMKAEFFVHHLRLTALLYR